MMKKVFALLMALMMVLGMGSAFAADNASQIGKYYEVNDATGALSAKPELAAESTQQVYGANIDDDAAIEDLVWLNKTITPTGTENLFDVTLEVVTAQKIEQIDLTEDAATVLVIDVSGSMNNSRLSSAKKAAQTFINTFANAASNVQRKIAIVKFSGSASNDIDGAYTVQGWTDASSIDTATNTSYCDAIRNLSAQGGTNIEAGLLLAENLLEDITTIKNKNIVLLTDGKPTYGVAESEETSVSREVICDNGKNQDSDGTETTCATHDDVETLSASLKKADISVYAVFVGDQQVECETCRLNSTGENWLRDDCGMATYSASDNDLDKLVTIFENISKQIAARAQAWEVTDPMGAQVDYVQLISADKNAFSQANEIVTWDLKKDTTAKYDETEKTYTYTATYRIYLDTLKNDFAEGTFYPTNNVTPLTWVVLDGDDNVTGADQADGGVKKAYFNVPSVQGYAAVVKKVDENGNNLAGAEFKLVHSCESCLSASKTWDSVTGTSNDDGVVVFTTGSAIPSGHSYTLTETKAPVGYVLNSEPVELVVSQGKIADETSYTMTNAPILTTVNATKVWNDANDQDGVRPDSIILILKANGNVLIRQQVTEQDGWKYTFSNLNKYANGQEIAYTVEEEAVTDYTTAITGSAAEGFTVTNTHTPATITVSGAKTWVDNDDQDGIRPESITINLMADGAKIDSKTVTAKDEWKWNFTELDQYKAGKEIVYTITEDDVSGYTAVVSEDGFNVTNTHTPETISVSGAKTWVDNDDQDGKRPDSITINLLADGEEVDSKTVSADNEGNWSWSFTNLPKYNAGQEIIYTIAEEAVTDYTTEVNGYNVTNTHEIEKVEVAGSKTWNDANNQDGKRPESITINLLANGERVDSKTVTAKDEWKWNFTELDKYFEGKEITYTITEDAVEGYSTELKGYDVVNSYTPGKVSVNGVKTWNDADNQDGLRPESITINLMADGAKIDSKTVTAKDEWKWNFTELDQYKAGKEIVYTVTEETVEGYTTTVDGYNVTNTHTPATTEVAGTKTWDDADNQDGKRPDSITINLLANGEKVKTAVVTAEDGWKYKFTDLPKFEAGVEIGYTISEEAVEGYSTTYDGYNVTNSYTPGKTNVAGAKTWIDNDDQDGKRPASITINLLADDEKVDSKTVTAKDEWKWNFENLDEYKAGKKIVYTIAEETVEGYEAKVEGFNVTNTHEIEKINIVGSKTWVGDTADMRPESITINLLADGEEKDEVVVTAADEWTWSFENLDKYQAGKEIVYTITEDAIDYYTATVDGYNVINTRNEVAAQSFNVTKKIEKTGAVAPVPGTYTFDFTVMAKKAEAPAMFMARQVVPNNNVTIQIDGGEQKTVAIGQPVTFSIDVEVTETGAEWKNTSKVNFWLNGEDAEGVAFEVVETSTAPKYWTYDNTAKTVALDNLEAGAVITNKYNEGYITTQIPVTKTVVQAGNIVPGVNTFYYELLFVTENRDKLNVSVVAAEDSIGKVVDLHNDQFSMTVDGAGQTSAYVVVQYPESADFKGILLLEKTSADGSVTMAELEAAGWIYDKSATREPMEDGSTLIYPWFIDLNEDGSMTIHNAEDQLVDSVNIVNTYTASTPPPKTGDNSNIALWLALMSASALCFVIISKRRNA